MSFLAVHTELTGNDVILLMQYVNSSYVYSNCSYRSYSTKHTCKIAIIHSLQILKLCLTRQPHVRWLSSGASQFLTDLFVAFKPVFSWELAFNSVAYMLCILYGACMRHKKSYFLWVEAVFHAEFLSWLVCAA